jgi:cell division protease FtsH
MSQGNNDRGWRGSDLFGGGGGGDDSGRRRRFSLWYLLAAILVLSLIQSLLGPTVVEAPLSGSEDSFVARLDAGDLKEVSISATSISWITQDDVRFKATLPPTYDPTSLIERLSADEVMVTATQPSPFLEALTRLLFPLLIMVGIWIFLIRRMRGGAGALSLGQKEKVKIYDRKEMKTTFEDVAGVDEAVAELREVVDFLREPSKYQRLGGRMPKGVLLLGPPGTGKTLLARAVAGEANVPFFFMSGSEFVEMFVGMGAKRVRDLFQQAKEKAPCLVFLDELDTIGRSRSGGGGYATHEEREQTLNQLLVEMDGFDSSKGVIIMAATNRPDVLDPALTRPGRFDRQVMVDRPDLRGREEILRVHVRLVTLEPSVDLGIIAARTPGFTGAELANVVNEAALLAVRRNREAVDMAELEEAIDRVVAGMERKSRVMSEREKVRVAVHEMGHALVALRTPYADPVHRVSIIPRGAAALGVTMQRPLEDRYLFTEAELEARLAVLLGGRAAEETIFGEVSTGALNDLRTATEIAREMVVEYGMSEQLGPISFAQNGLRSGGGQPLYPSPDLPENVGLVVSQEVQRIVGEARQRALDLLQADRQLLEALSAVLIEQEVMEGADLQAYVTGQRPLPEAKTILRVAEPAAAG